MAEGDYQNDDGMFIIQIKGALELTHFGAYWFNIYIDDSTIGKHSLTVSQHN